MTITETIPLCLFFVHHSGRMVKYMAVEKRFVPTDPYDMTDDGRRVLQFDLRRARRRNFARSRSHIKMYKFAV